jgi:opacity protein-like surface antigen
MLGNPATRALSCMFTAAGALAAMPTSAASAADLGHSDTAAYEQYQSQSVAHRNFYVRGDLGIARHSFGGFSQADLADNGGSFISQAIDDSVTMSAGVGIQINKRLRIDFTGEYRSTARLKGLDNVTANLVDPDGKLQANTLYQGSFTSYVGLLNGYYDLFNWRGFTPYLGAGIGFAHNKLSGITTGSTSTFIDATTGEQSVQASSGTALSHGQTNLAWALMAGTSFDLSQNSKLDFGYRYINLGQGVSTMTGPINCVCGTTGLPLKVSDLEAHEFRIGVRWLLGSEPQQPYQPLK